MPKDRRVNSSSFDRATVSPYSCNLKISDHSNCEGSSPHVGDEREWEEARCPICMEHPHNAVLLICSSQEKGCRPFICDTSYRHSNCLDQFRKSSAASYLQPQEEQRIELVCPLCRGLITGCDVVQPARSYMNSKTRSCSLETCIFSGNYAELRKHARLEHPSERPSEASPTRKSNWNMLEQQREIEDAFAHQSDIEYDWDGWPSWDEGFEDDFWSDGSFFDFPSGMSDIEDELLDEMFMGLTFSFFSVYPYSPEEDMMDTGGSRSTGRHQRTTVSTNPGSMSSNQVGNALPRSSYHNENGATVSRSRSSYPRGTDARNLRSRSSYHRESGSTISSSRPPHHRENRPTSLRTSSNHSNANGSTISRSRRGNTPASAGTRSSYHRELGWPSLRARSRYYHQEVAPPVRWSASATRHLPSSSRQPRSDFGRREE